MSAKPLGLLLLLAAFASLAFEPQGSAILQALHLFLFCALFTCALLLLMGWIGSPPQVVALRARARPPPRTAEPHPPTTTRSFARPPLGAAAIALIGLLSLMMLALAVWAIAAWQGPLDEALIVTAPLLVGGIGLPMYVYCDARKQWTLTPQGITVDGCRRHRTDWSSVLAIECRQARFSGAPEGRIYTLYARDRNLHLSGRIDDIDQLLLEVIAATGLDWS